MSEHIAELKESIADAEQFLKDNLDKYQNAIKVINAEILNRETYELAKYCDYILATKEFAEWMTGMKIDYNNLK